jgi:anti-anti-sigma regulatory factor
LIVDLAEVDFIALDGLHALLALNIQCARAGATLALIASRAVNRLLRVGDHDKVLPAVGSATEALLLIRRSGRGRRSLQLVSPAS